MKKTVFISSTFVDLREERKQVSECLSKFDVTVKGMEDFGARSEDPLTTCISEVEKSDIFIAIIGMRYGSEDKDTGKSFSQLEYEKAVEKKLTILIYLCHDTNYSVSLGNIQTEKLEKLKTFKEILRTKHNTDTFTDTADLIRKLNRKFTDLLTVKDSILFEDEFDKAKEIMEKFFLVPSAYSGQEIKLIVQFIERPKSASQEICNSFNLEFGKTIVSKINVIKPKFEFQNLKYLFIPFSFFEKFMSLLTNTDYSIYANVLFSSKKVYSIYTEFKDELQRVYHNEQQYDPQDDYVDPGEYTDYIKAGDGQIALVLKDIINPK